jgi:hypothetical protein
MLGLLVGCSGPCDQVKIVLLAKFDCAHHTIKPDLKLVMSPYRAHTSCLNLEMAGAGGNVTIEAPSNMAPKIEEHPTKRGTRLNLFTDIRTDFVVHKGYKTYNS